MDLVFQSEGGEKCRTGSLSTPGTGPLVSSPGSVLHATGARVNSLLYIIILFFNFMLGVYCFLWCASVSWYEGMNYYSNAYRIEILVSTRLPLLASDFVTILCNWNNCSNPYPIDFHWVFSIRQMFYGFCCISCCWAMRPGLFAGYLLLISSLHLLFE